MKCAPGIEARDVEEMYINIDPIQAGGRLTADAMKAAIAYGDGYSVCDNCLKPFRLDYIQNPPIAQFHEELAEWLNMDTVRVVPGARRGFQAVASTYVEKGDPVIVTSLAHYTEFMAVEAAGGVPREIPKDATNHITPDAAAEKIEAVIREFSRTPPLLFVDHVDYQYGNVHDVAGVVKVAHQYDIPVLVNGAYSVGVMPVDGKALGADFVVGSGHKSMAAPAPSGLLATTDEHAEQVFRTTEAKGDVTGRTFGMKEVEMMGCTLMGVTVVGMMSSFPHVRERVRNWETEVAHSQEVTEALLSIEGTKVLSDYPRRHTLTRVDTRGSFDTVAREHKKRGYFLSSELKRRGITGVIPGSTRVWKFNTFGLTAKQIRHVGESFVEIARENGLNIL
ncbi:MAG TPA: O-phospho-L-seryl-tRNA:Cys-tRNA synthase [Candidatus Methanoculleus thermohydrogenotrophicum]|jgi:Sep-tRNA:Cys-tRNA synthetase|nr:O-phospho-L-seryl-tRNA:Cys-tRNA synthase [Candidatus Methanoculleus thermohydrogenotrophicum]NLM81038.1 O-phospho-L-seryl-tRNA:Cys-tRNA synthase [Candidatus Methanoculleus thermohydrogenotrophicum]HOB17927.1 O-phospho-L-seryl-tRNA:Cys-tRNA synthase [Candidatus Methanoculleus thermohydrogenotrophicum]HPZ38199.1 O-phospho-L-seryl-tRNA:Cys-tRNA synthase [Candidatus Methanoculleus thermohydrogenotrophicum]HQC91444.1 O-phospho-L-seryl-tRNA:Cys-tRNA synthase [Candidatus Methanoculleus thermohydrog